MLTLGNYRSLMRVVNFIFIGNNRLTLTWVPEFAFFLKKEINFGTFGGKIGTHLHIDLDPVFSEPFTKYEK